MIWIVSGGCSNVGKTYLASSIQKCLRNCAISKIGHREATNHKPRNYFGTMEEFQAWFAVARLRFEEHIVESNTLAKKEGFGDIRIFIAAPEGSRNIRHDADELQQCADVTVSPGISTPALRRALVAKATQLSEGELDAVLHHIVIQRDWIATTGPAVERDFGTPPALAHGDSPFPKVEPE